MIDLHIPAENFSTSLMIVVTGVSQFSNALVYGCDCIAGCERRGVFVESQARTVGEVRGGDDGDVRYPLKKTASSGSVLGCAFSIVDSQSRLSSVE